MQANADYILVFYLYFNIDERKNGQNILPFTKKAVILCR